ncbi:MAG: hypothetical protein WCJ19_05560 [bacterium]
MSLFNFDPNSIPVKASTQDHLDIFDIVDDLVVLKSGQVSLVLTTTAINFQLLSEAEQNAKIESFAALINSLTFPLQVVVHTEKKDIRAHIDDLEKQERSQTNASLRAFIRTYIEFLKTLIVKNNVLEKKFYAILPYLNAYSVVNETFSQKVMNTVTGKKPYPTDVEKLIEKAKIDLYPKRDTIIKLFSRIGIKAVQLKSEQLKIMYRRFYNVDEPIPYSTLKLTKQEI